MGPCTGSFVGEAVAWWEQRKEEQLLEHDFLTCFAFGGHCDPEILEIEDFRKFELSDTPCGLPWGLHDCKDH